MYGSKLSWLMVSLVVFALALSASAQQCQRIFKQDSALNNFVDPPGYQTSPLGELGAVNKVGIGPRKMILVPGLGFGGNVFDEFMAPRAQGYTMYAVTFAGFGGTAAPPSPSADVSFSERTWLNAAKGAIEKLMDDEKMDHVVLVAHWLAAPSIALELAIAHPERVSAVVIISGAPCFVSTDTAKYPVHPPLTYRVKAVDQYMAPKWFKTVTRETWDDNNFLPGDYAVNPIRALRLWREAAEPRLHVWTRYLCEFYTQDITLSLDSLTVPTLIVKPGLEGNYSDSGQDYMTGFCHIGWEASAPKNPKIVMTTIPNSRAFIWFDQPEKLDSAVNEFLATKMK